MTNKYYIYRNNMPNSVDPRWLGILSRRQFTDCVHIVF